MPTDPRALLAGIRRFDPTHSPRGNSDLIGSEFSI